MKKPFFFLLLLLSYCFYFTSCGTSKIFEDTETKVHPTQIDSLIHGKFVEVVVDSSTTLKLIFDTGSTISTINNIALIGGEKVLNKNNHIKLKGANAFGFITTIGYKTKSFNFNTSTSEGQTIAIYKKPKIPLTCFQNLFDNDGVLGLNSFSQAINPKPLLLNYEHNFIKVLPSIDLLTNNYKKVDASFGKNRIYLNAVIHGKKKKLVFDTGSNSFIILNDHIFKKEDGQEKVHQVESFSMSTNNLYPTKSFIAKDVEIKIDGLTIDDSIIKIMGDANQDNIGLPFIKNYNWVIDFKNETLYAKKIKSFDSNDFFNKIKNIEYAALALKGQLFIIYSKNKKYEVGDIIISINGKKVTENNLCAFQKLLIENSGEWQKLNIVTK